MVYKFSFCFVWTLLKYYSSHHSVIPNLISLLIKYALDRSGWLFLEIDYNGFVPPAE